MWEEYFARLLFEALGKDVGDMSKPAFISMVGYWFFDVSGNDAKEWWALLAKLPKEMNGAIEAFLGKVAGCFVENVEFLRRYDELAPMLADLVPRFENGTQIVLKDRFKGTAHYSDFVRYVQRELVLTVPLVCLLGGEMSGDMFGLGAMMLVDPEARVLIMTGADPTIDHTAEIEGFLKLCAPTRVDVTNKAKTDKNAALLRIMNAEGQVFLPMPYYLGTLYMSFASGWERGHDRGWIRDGWGVSNERGFSAKCRTLVRWLVAEKGVPLPDMIGRKVLILWSRFTGKKGEIHVEHDTSFTGIKQLAIDALALGYYVIIAGDRPIVHRLAKPHRPLKFDLICEELNSKYGRRVFNLTGFWGDRSWGLIAENRLDQFRLYELLHRACDVRHLGMRSGNLEALALLGYWVRYMEEVGSQGGERMSAWHGIGLGYERIVIEAPPTRTGKYVVEAYKNASFYPKKLDFIATRNVGVRGTVGDPSKIKVKVLPEKVRLRLEKKAKEREERGEVRIVEEEPPKPKPDVSTLERGFREGDRLKISTFLASANTCTRFERLPFDWASLLGEK